MKKLKNNLILYLIYCIVLFALLTIAMTVEISTDRIRRDFANIFNFIDYYTILFVLAICFLVLICTKSLKSLKNAFVFLWTKQHYSLQQCKASILSIKFTMIGALMGGCILTISQAINMRFYITLSLLPMLYVVIICALMLPIHILLKRECYHLETE